MVPNWGDLASFPNSMGKNWHSSKSPSVIQLAVAWDADKYPTDSQSLATESCQSNVSGGKVEKTWFELSCLTCTIAKSIQGSTLQSQVYSSQSNSGL